MSGRDRGDDLQGEATLRAEALAFASVVGRLGLAASPLAPRPGVRARLIEAIRTNSRLTIVRAGDGAWDATPVGALAKHLLRDPLARRATTIVHMPPGSTYPAHRHRDTEELYVLAGSLDVHGVHLGPGDYCAGLGGSMHGNVSTEDGCQFLVSASEDDDVVEAGRLSNRGLLFVPGSHGAWGPREAGVAVRRVAVDPHVGLATVLVRADAGSRCAIRGQQIYVLAGEARLTDGRPLRAGDFCGTLAGTVEVEESPTGCLLLVLAARGAIAQEVRA